MKKSKSRYIWIAAVLLLSCALLTVWLLRQDVEPSPPENYGNCIAYLGMDSSVAADIKGSYNCVPRNEHDVYLQFKDCGGGKQGWWQVHNIDPGDLPENEPKWCYAAPNKEWEASWGDGYCKPNSAGTWSCDMVTCCCRSC